MSAHNVQ